MRYKISEEEHLKIYEKKSMNQKLCVHLPYTWRCTIWFSFKEKLSAQVKSIVSRCFQLSPSSANAVTKCKVIPFLVPPTPRDWQGRLKEAGIRTNLMSHTHTTGSALFSEDLWVYISCLPLPLLNPASLFPFTGIDPR